MEDWVLETVRAHARPLLATAHRHSLCADDAHDAYQRGLEILLRRADRLEPAGVSRWLHTVVKHEAMAIRALRLRDVPRDSPPIDSGAAAPAPSAEERAAELDRLALAAEALERLKPAHVRALLLRAEGHSYEDIAQVTGWSPRKVSRCVAEGRRAFRERVEAIDSGAECAHWSGVLSAVADGEAGARELRAVRPHLRNCPACRATLRAYREAPATVAALLPAGALVAPAADGPSALSRLWDALAGGLHERAALSGMKLVASADVLTSAKATTLAVSATALAGGGATLAGHHAPGPPAPRAAVHARQAFVPPVAPPVGRRSSARRPPAGRPRAAPARPRAVVAPASEFAPAPSAPVAAPVRASVASVASPSPSPSPSTRRARGRSTRPASGEFGP